MKYEQSRNPVSFFYSDLLGQLTSLPMQYTRSHWFPAYDPTHLGGGQFWSRFAFTIHSSFTKFGQLTTRKIQ